MEITKVTINDLIMTRNQFIHYSYRHSEIIIYHQRHPDVDIECMLIGVDFDNELFHLVPIDQYLYEDRSYWLPYTSCDKQFKKPKMKVVRGDRTIVTK